MGILMSRCTGSYLERCQFSILLLSNAAFGTIVTVVYILIEHWISGNSFHVYTNQQYVILAWSCLANLTNTACFTISFQYGTSGFVSLVSCTSVAWALVADILIFDESLPAMEIIGGSIILIVTCARSAIRINEERKKKAK